MKAASIFFLCACALAAVAFARSAAPVVDNTAAEEEGDDFNDYSGDPGGWTDAAADAVDSVNPVAIMERNTVTQDTQDLNVSAFLAMLRHSEGTDREPDPYTVCYGYTHTIQDFSDHPKITGEWPGVSIENLGPQYAGKISTAAGAYQIIKPTWQGCKRALALPDFSPASQDAAAVYLIREAGALDYVKAGQFEDAVSLCARQWASLPGANAPGQGMRRLNDLMAVYTAAGGSFA